VTPEHPFLVLDLTDKPYIAWISAEKILNLYKHGRRLYLGIPRKIVTSLSFERIDEEVKKWIEEPVFWELIGLYLADGSINQVSKWPRQITFYFGYDKKNERIIDRLCTIASYLDISYSESVNRNCITVILNSSRLVKFILANFGHGRDGKYINWNVFNLPLQHKIYLLRGLILGNGWVSDEYKRVVFVNTNLNIVSTVRLLFANLGIVTVLHNVGLTRDIRGYEGKRNAWHIITLAQQWDYVKKVLEGELNEEITSHTVLVNTVPNVFAYITRDFIWLPIDEVTTVEYVGKVYNLEVENTHSYLFHSGVVTHNCPLYAAVCNLGPNWGRITILLNEVPHPKIRTEWMFKYAAINEPISDEDCAFPQAYTRYVLFPKGTVRIRIYNRHTTDEMCFTWYAHFVKTYLDFGIWLYENVYMPFVEKLKYTILHPQSPLIKKTKLHELYTR